MVQGVFSIGLLLAVVSLGGGYFYWRQNPTDEYHTSWGTIVFTVLTLSQMGNVLALRSSRDSLFQIGLFSNPAMVGAVALTLVLQLAVIYVPFLQRLFRTQALSVQDMMLCLLLSSLVFLAVETHKWWIRRSTERP
jgi:Ca2+-transporting ATPase